MNQINPQSSRLDSPSEIDHKPPSSSNLTTSSTASSPISEEENRRTLITEIDAQNAPWLRRRATIAGFIGFSLFVDMVVYGLVVPMLPSMPFISTNRQLGFLFASYALGLLMSAPIIGYFSESFQCRKLPMVGGLSGLCITTILFVNASTFWHLILARILQGFSAGAPWTIGLSIMADIYSPDQLGSVIGPVLACNHAGFIAGPIIGGCLFQYFGYTSPFYFSACLTLFNLLLWLLVEEHELKSGSMNEEEEPLLITTSDLNTDPLLITTSDLNTDPEANNPRTMTKLGMLTLLKSPCIQINVLVVIVIGGIFSGLEPTLPLYLQKVYALTPAQIGVVFVSLIVPALITSAVAGILCDTYRGIDVLILGLLSMSLVSPVPAIPEIPFWGVVLGLSLFGAVESLVITPVVPIMAQYMTSQGSKSYASVYALFNSAYSVGILIGPIISSMVYAQFGFLILMSACGICVGLVLMVVTFNRHQFVY